MATEVGMYGELRGVVFGCEGGGSVGGLRELHWVASRQVRGVVMDDVRGVSCISACWDRGMGRRDAEG